MKKQQRSFVGLLITTILMLTACDKASDGIAPEKEVSTFEVETGKPWTKEQGAAFMKGCVASADASAEKKGISINRDVINQVCACSGEKIASKYSFEAAEKISTEEMRSFVIQTTKACAVELKQ